MNPSHLYSSQTDKALLLNGIRAYFDLTVVVVRRGHVVCAEAPLHFGALMELAAHHNLLEDLFLPIYPCLPPGPALTAKGQPYLPSNLSLRVRTFGAPSLNRHFNQLGVRTCEPVDSPDPLARLLELALVFPHPPSQEVEPCGHVTLSTTTRPYRYHELRPVFPPRARQDFRPYVPLKPMQETNPGPYSLLGGMAVRILVRLDYLEEVYSPDAHLEAK